MLTDAKARTAKPYRLPDGEGLYLWVTPAGKSWRLWCRVGGKEQILTFGAYPHVTLADARERRDVAKAALAAGKDPRVRPDEPTTPTFEEVARAWHVRQTPSWTERHAEDVISSLAGHVFPELGARPIVDITPAMVLTVLRKIEARPTVETAHRVRQRMSMVFVDAIASGLAQSDPAAVVKPALATIDRKRQAAITDLAQALEMLAKVEAIPAHPATRLALRFLALTSVRPGEVRAAAWTEFEGLDGAEPIWRIPAERMKMKREHVVPLSRQALEVLEAIRPLSARAPYVFPSTRWARKPMSENALGYLLNRAGYHQRQVPHGWRATFSSVMNERFSADRAVIDLMLAHALKDAVEAAYNRGTYMPRRRELAQMWADLLLDGAVPAEGLVGVGLEGEKRFRRDPAARSRSAAQAE